jgi:hypothetical protein
MLFAASNVSFLFSLEQYRRVVSAGILALTSVRQALPCERFRERTRLRTFAEGLVRRSHVGQPRRSFSNIVCTRDTPSPRPSQLSISLLLFMVFRETH